jgi:sortase A
MKRIVRIVAWTMVWSGGMTLGLVGYQLFVTDLINESVQAEAREDLVDELEFRREELAAPILVEEPPQSTVATDQIEPVAYYPEQIDEEGVPFAELRIPDIGLDAVLFEGVTPASLRNGPGHMPWTPLPGQPGNAVISGHRTTYGAPFFDLDLLEPGDEIEVDTVIGSHTYTVRETVIVTPTDVWVTDPRPGAWLTLTTCHPKLSARERLIVFAELTAGPNLAYVDFLSTQIAGA